MPHHVGHQYDLFETLKNDCEFYLLESLYRQWSHWSRPLPKYVKRINYYEPSKYDFAILHIDQQAADYKLGKVRSFIDLKELTKDIPQIVINHGSPIWPERYGREELKMRIAVILKGVRAVIVNSWQAEKEWEGIHQNIIPIIHGMNPNDWWDLPKEARVVTGVSVAGCDKYYNRILFWHVKKMLEEKGIRLIEFKTDIVANNWNEYRDYLGRSLLYFDYSLHTPFNRGRTEAMLSGCCVLTCKNHDVEKFIVNGKNGVILKNNPWYCADMIEELLTSRYQECVRVGQAGKETAKQFFSRERYRDQWLKVINDVVSKKRK